MWNIVPSHQTMRKLNFEEWCKHMTSTHLQFDYWYTVLQLELLFMQFFRSSQQKFMSYVESLGKMFDLDDCHYTQWMTIHVIFLLLLERTGPTTYSEFVSGKFVIQKSRNKFSSRAHDHVYEQLNTMGKGKWRSNRSHRE